MLSGRFDSCTSINRTKMDCCLMKGEKNPSTSLHQGREFLLSLLMDIHKMLEYKRMRLTSTSHFCLEGCTRYTA